VQIIENEQNVGIGGLISLVLTLGFLFVFGFIIYVKLQERFGPQDEGSRKKKG
jgi:hypothetical protein